MTVRLSRKLVERASLAAGRKIGSGSFGDIYLGGCSKALARSCQKLMSCLKRLAHRPEGWTTVHKATKHLYVDLVGAAEGSVRWSGYVAVLLAGTCQDIPAAQRSSGTVTSWPGNATSVFSSPNS